MLDRRDIERRLRQTGAESLSDTELLYLCGVTACVTDPLRLLDSSFSSMLGEGIPAAAAYRLSSIAEMARRIRTRTLAQPRQIRSSADAFGHLSPVLSHLDHEECWAIFLNRSNGIIATSRITSGGISSTVIDARMIAREACNRCASGVILAHNHPSSNPVPSSADIANTNSLRDILSLLDISLLDHIIIAGGKHYSFAEERVI